LSLAPVLGVFGMQNRTREVLGEDGEDLIDARCGRSDDGLELVLMSRLADLACEVMIVSHEVLMSYPDDVKDSAVG